MTMIFETRLCPELRLFETRNAHILFIPSLRPSVLSKTKIESAFLSVLPDFQGPQSGRSTKKLRSVPRFTASVENKIKIKIK